MIVCVIAWVVGVAVGKTVVVLEGEVPLATDAQAPWNPELVAVVPPSQAMTVVSVPALPPYHSRSFAGWA